MHLSISKFLSIAKKPAIVAFCCMTVFLSVNRLNAATDLENKQTNLLEPASGLEKLQSCELKNVTGNITLNFFSHEATKKYALAYNRVRNEKYEEAVKYLKEIAEEYPQDTLPLYCIISCWRKGKEYQKALDCVNDLIKKYPESADAYLYRARCWESKGEYAKAVSDLEKSIELNHSFIYAYNSLAWVLATCPEASVRNGDKALVHAQKGLSLLAEPENGCDNLYGLSRFSMALDKEAKNQILTSLFLDTLAGGYGELQQYSKAVETQKKAIATLKGSKAKEKWGYMDYREAIRDCKKRLKNYKSGQPWREECALQDMEYE